MSAENLAKEVVRQFSEQKKTLSFAESCTGGFLSHLVTNVSGSSEVFWGSLVTYSNDFKTNWLGVSSEILSESGAVSAECAEGMALGLKEKTKADFCVSVTGIAGPTGGTPEKPIGTVFIAFAFGDDVEVQHHVFSGSRILFKEQVAQTVFQKLLE